jgi:hypothetical protein
VGPRASSSSKWAPRPSPKSELNQRAPRNPLIVAGFVALALLALGEAAPAAWPVSVALEVRGDALVVQVDGADHALSAALGTTWRGVVLEQPGPLLREYQVDGSDTTSTNDRDPRFLASVLHTPPYPFDAWLRDEGSFSRWERVRIVDPATGQALPARVVESDGPSGHRTELAFADANQPGAALGAFRVEAALRRPEAAAHLWLVPTAPGQQEGLELDRDRRNARWLIQRGSVTEPLPRWFFPEQALPFAANLLHLVGRATAAGYALALSAALFAMLCAALARSALVAHLVRPSAARGPRRDTATPRPPPSSMRGEPSREPSQQEPQASHEASQLRGLSTTLAALRWPDIILAVWLLGAGVVATRLFQQLPHIIDAVSYSFQAGVFRTGQVSLPVPALEGAFKGPFQIIWHERWFSQYPPGAPFAYALGGLLGLSWVVGLLACVALIGATSWTAGALYGPRTGWIVLGLGVLSPFVLFQSGSFLSHPIAGGLLALALAAFVRGERSLRLKWYALTGALLGVAFLTREAASVLFALPLAVRLLGARRWPALTWLAACGVPFALIYLAYNTALTGSPLVLPRTLFDASDRFGFGDGVGFHHRHTLAAGLANTDELLTLLQFDLFGWPPLFGLGLLGLPFLLGRPRSWDLSIGLGVLAFVVAYTAYFYHGIALGPRYYFEAVPWLLLLAGRGAQRMAQVAGSRVAVGVVLGVLSLHTLLFYLPAELARRVDFSAFPDARPISLAFVRVGLLGPRLENVPAPSLILTGDWWLFNTALAPLNCPSVPDCPALFALATTPQDATRLRATYPGRIALRAVDHDGRIDLEPD